MSDKPSIEYHIAYLHMLRALRPFRRARAFLVGVVLPADVDEDDWKLAARNVLNDIVKDVEIDEDDEYRDVRRVARSANSVAFFEVAGRKSRVDYDPVASLVMGNLRTIGLVRRDQAGEILDHPSLAIIDAVIDIPALDPMIVQRAANNAFGAQISRQDAKELIAMPAKLRDSLRRTGRPLGQVIARLREAKATRVAPAGTVITAKSELGPRLEDLHGYGKAKLWGIELVRDLQQFKSGRLSWDDVDGGLLLSGPPGTGKTTFARALANSCDVKLLVGSYSSWQSAGHQGDMLRAMRKTFDAAREAAPSILLIDEIDSFVDRGKTGDHQEYMRGVVNGLLEQLDGAVERTGVVVIGACNDPDNLDPALRRPGRLDRHIQIGYPDETARAEILRYHLQAGIDVSAVIARTDGMSGADLERIARDARRLARRDQVPVMIEHVTAALPELLPRTPEQIRLIAIHELGHAVTAIVTGVEEVLEVVATKAYEPREGVGIGGYTRFAKNPVLLRTRSFIADKVTTMLGGLAAEEVIYGAHSDGVRADLTTATQLAAYALGSVGMGDTLLSDGAVDPAELLAVRRRSYDLDRRIDKFLQEQRKRAVEIVRDYREVIEGLADRLADRGKLDGPDVVAAVRARGIHQPKPPVPAL